MDSLTHIALGACIGELTLTKHIGKKALVWGALSQSLPDIDSAASLWLPADHALIVHRGLTHSLLVAAIAGLLLALLVKGVYNKKHLPLTLLIAFFCGQLVLHDLLDTCNSYGTGLLEPFSHQRFSLNMLYVADPFFSIGLMVASLFLAFSGLQNKKRIISAVAAILLSFAYLCYAGFNKMYVSNKVSASMEAQHIIQKDFITTPTPFNCMLWYVIVAANNGYYTTYISVWDSRDRLYSYTLHPANTGLIEKLKNDSHLNYLIRFSDGYYTLENRRDSIYFNILRFGQVQGWQYPNAEFSFHYLLNGKNNDQALVLQKGRLAGWNKNSIKAFIQRISGN